MVDITQIVQTPTFKKAVKKLKQNQKVDLDSAVRAIADNPNLGLKKKGDLAYLHVHKFKMVNQETLLGYSHKDNSVVLELLNLGG